MAALLQALFLGVGGLPLASWVDTIVVNKRAARAAIAKLPMFKRMQAQKKWVPIALWSDCCGGVQVKLAQGLSQLAFEYVATADFVLAAVNEYNGVVTKCQRCVFYVGRARLAWQVRCRVVSDPLYRRRKHGDAVAGAVLRTGDCGHRPAPRDLQGHRESATRPVQETAGRSAATTCGARQVTV